ncbi:MAG: SDR family oxidoreductase [Sedimentisphaerales bacterium]|nr:SDR family oxidoreductase [Sedimentisphaerales bacterium]
MNNNDRLTAFITGASSGIGAVYARSLAKRGYNLVLHGRRRELLEQHAEQLRREFGVDVEIVIAELSDPQEMQNLEQHILHIDKLGFLVNNAGFGLPEDFHSSDSKDNQIMLRVHAEATIRLTHAALKVMLPRKSGAIVNVSSVAGFLISSRNAMYCATKAFLNTFSESLYLELHGSGIKVQVLCPGFTTTDFHKKLDLVPRVPMSRKFMSAEYVVNASLRDLDRGKPVCIPGGKYKLVPILLRVLPRWVLYRIVLRIW